VTDPGIRLTGTVILSILLGNTFLFFYGCGHQQSDTNVLLITIDTLRADHLSCYGYSRKITPTLDRLAGNGILFENAFCAMPTTVPSHGSIFFGTWPRVHGSLSNSYLYSNKNLSFLPALMRNAGYTTAAVISSRHLANAMQRVPGFDSLICQPKDQSAPATLSLALKWFENNRPKRFFVWVHLWDPHWPYLLHPEIMARINPTFRDDIEHYNSFLPKQAYSRDGLNKMVDLYDNEIAFVDYHLGLFLDKLRTISNLKNTMIIVTSDHGESLDEMIAKYNYAFDHGEFLFDSQLHVPLIVVLPEGRTARVRIRQAVTLLDIMPSVLDDSRIPIPTTVDGRSFMPLIQRKNISRLPDSVFFQRRIYGNRFQTPDESEQQFGIRDTNCKLIYNLPSGTCDLYKNSEEWQPFQGDEATKQQLLLRLQGWLRQTKHRASEHLESTSQGEIEKLKALGYVQ